MSTHTNHKNLKDLFAPRSEEKELKHDSIMLMSAFLSEIEFIQEQRGITRKELSDKIKITNSYLTQVFRNKKPLNFLTLAKIKRALNLRFEVKAYDKELPMPSITPPVYTSIEPQQAIKQYLEEVNDAMPKEGSKFFITEGKNFSKTSQVTSKPITYSLQ